MKGLDRKKEMILERERYFANAIGSAVFEKPKVSLWMILIPILFMHFIYRMQKFKNGRLKFDEEFMITRRRAMDRRLTPWKPEPAEHGPVGSAIRPSGLPRKALRSWMRALVEYYTDLLNANGDSFESMVRAAYRNRTDYLLTLNRLNTVEKEFYTALTPHMGAAEGAADIIATIESQSQKLRRELAEQIFR